MLHEEVAPPPAKYFESARLIFVLRDPVERLYSNYRFAVNAGYPLPTSDFSGVIRDAENEWRQTMVDLEMYCEQLRRYADYLSRDQRRIFLFADLVNETDAFVRDCFEFVGVDPDVDVQTDQAHNETDNLQYPGLCRLLHSLWAH
jgi:hypothetical protein